MSLSKPRPILEDMPYQIKKMIVESIPSYLDRLPLRKTSKEFMGVVDIAKFEMKLEIRDKTIEIERRTPNALTKVHSTITEAISHFKCFISKPNVTFSEMNISGAHCAEVLEMLTATVHTPLRVKHFRMVKGGQARILEFMEPGTLERVCLIDLDQAEAMSIFRMEQWRQAQNVSLINMLAACEIWWDFPRFEIYFNLAINSTDLPRILEHISNSDTFVSGKIHTFWRIEATVEVLGGGDWEWKQDQDRFAEKTFPVGNRGSRIIVKVFETSVEFELKQSE